MHVFSGEMITALFERVNYTHHTPQIGSSAENNVDTPFVHTIRTCSRPATIWICSIDKYYLVKFNAVLYVTK